MTDWSFPTKWQVDARSSSARPRTSGGHDRPRLLASDQSGVPLALDGGVPVAMARAPRRLAYLAAKRAFDVVCSLLALLVLWPILVIVGVLVRLESPGAAIFAQRREGLGGRAITIYKFRTVHIGQCDVRGLSPVLPEDPRVTALGRVLRATRIDELPQLINVLRGDMSMVGPRPHVPGMTVAARDYARLVPYYAMRHAMRPGLTGWAQANGLHGPVLDAETARRRIDHDIAYIQNASLALDALALWRTVISAIGRR